MRLVFTGLHVTDASETGDRLGAPRRPSFDPRSVVLGQLLPTAIVVDRPTLEADITREGGMLKRVLAQSDSSTQGEFVDLLIEQLLAEHNYHSLLGQLDTVQVANARVSLRDVTSGVTWIAPDAQARLQRDAAGVAISANARFPAHVAGADRGPAVGHLCARPQPIALRQARRMKPSMLADLSPDAAILRGLDIALSDRFDRGHRAGRNPTVASKSPPVPAPSPCRASLTPP